MLVLSRKPTESICIADEIVRMRRHAEGRKPAERIAVELDPSVAERMRETAQREGLEVGDLLAGIIERQLFVTEPVEGERKRPRRRRGARAED